MQTDDHFKQRNQYFTTPALKALMQQLHHLAFFGDGVSLVEGDSGSGKSVMVDELAKLFDGVSEFFSLTIPPDAELGESMGEIGAALGLLNDNALTVGEVLAQLRHYSQSLVQDKKLSVICIDDAHHLDDQAVGALLSLLQGREENNYGLHFIFFAQSGLVDQIDALHIIDVPVYDFAMPELSVEELERFVNAVAPSKLQADAKTFAKLHTLSSGNPGKVLKLIGEPDKVEQPAMSPQVSEASAQFKDQFTQAVNRQEEAVTEAAAPLRSLEPPIFAADDEVENRQSDYTDDDFHIDNTLNDDADDFAEDHVHLSRDYHEDLLDDDVATSKDSVQSASRRDDSTALAGSVALGPYIDKAKALMDKLVSLPVTHLAAISLLTAILLWSVFFTGGDEAPKSVVATVPLPTLNAQGGERGAGLEDGTRILQLGEREQQNSVEDDQGFPPTEPGSIEGAYSGGEPSDQNALASSTETRQARNEALSTRQTSVAEPINTPQIVATVAPKPVVSTPSTAELPERESAVAAPIARANKMGKPTSDEQYLLEQSDEAFTLQVLAASKHDSLTRYIARQPNKSDLHMYRGTREGKSWYVVVANVYPSKEAAVKARNKLPQEQVNAGPWPRKLSSIQEEIKTYLKKHPE